MFTKLDIIFLDKQGHWKRVIISGNGVRFTSYVWKNKKIEKPTDVQDVDNYITFKKYMIDRNTEMVLSYKEQIFKSVVNYIKPFSPKWIWINENSVI